MGRVAVASILLICLIPVSILVNRIVPDPYMDEIFHIPQAQQYCKGYFTKWDPMITTPPGLYFISPGFVASLFPGLGAVYDTCSTSILRFTNVVLSVICSLVVYEIITHLRPSLDDKKATFRAVVLSLYPLHWFFAFLYYTDVASLTAVLAMYLLTLKKKYLLSSLFGALAMLIRQTNIIWMIFVACTGVLEFTQSRKKDITEKNDFSSSKENENLSVSSGVSTISSLRRRKVNSRGDSQNGLTSQLSLHTTHSRGLLEEIQDIIVISWSHRWEFMCSFSPFVMVLLAFVAFVLWNGSIVLGIVSIVFLLFLKSNLFFLFHLIPPVPILSGAKDAHAVSSHFAQVLYYGMVSTLFMVPVHLSLDQTAVIYHQFCKNTLLTIFQWFMALTAGFVTVHFFSIAHPYLLADNRHYTFYLWRKVINYHWTTKYIMVPLYVYSWFSIISNLGKNQKKTLVLVYFLACAATLVPAPLIEFRYYTIPFFFLILHTPIQDNKSWFLMGVLYLLINCFTMYMFLFRPFSWKHEAGTQRFIW